MYIIIRSTNLGQILLTIDFTFSCTRIGDLGCGRVVAKFFGPRATRWKCCPAFSLHYYVDCSYSTEVIYFYICALILRCWWSFLLFDSYTKETIRFQVVKINKKSLTVSSQFCYGCIGALRLIKSFFSIISTLCLSAFVRLFFKNWVKLTDQIF